jgi:hypothetical protein
MKYGRVLLFGVVLVFGLLAWRVFEPGNGLNASQETLAADSTRLFQEDDVEVGPGDNLPRVAVSDGVQRLEDEPNPLSAAAFLKDYPEGEAIIARLTEDGRSLSEYRPLGETEAEAIISVGKRLLLTEEGKAGKIKASLSWPESGELTNEWLLSELRFKDQFSDEQLAYARSQISGFQVRYELQVRAYVDLLDKAVSETVSKGGFSCHPYANPVVAKDQDKSQWQKKGGTFFSTGVFTGSGWGGGFVLFRDDHPQAASLRKTISVMRRERNDLLLAYLRE